jgi:AraC-like DNA-binding protein
VFVAENNPGYTNTQNSIGNNDVCIIMAASLLAEEKGKEVVLISDDTGFSYKAKGKRGLRVLKPFDDWMLEEEKSEEEKKIQALSQENRELKKQEPEIVIRLSIDGHQYNNQESFPIINRTVPFVEEERIKEQPHVKTQELAEMVGFNSATSFIRVFNRYVGMTPQNYADNILGQSKEKRQ